MRPFINPSFPPPVASSSPRPWSAFVEPSRPGNARYRPPTSLSAIASMAKMKTHSQTLTPPNSLASNTASSSSSVFLCYGPGTTTPPLYTSIPRLLTAPSSLQEHVPCRRALLPAPLLPFPLAPYSLPALNPHKLNPHQPSLHGPPHPPPTHSILPHSHHRLFDPQLHSLHPPRHLNPPLPLLLPRSLLRFPDGHRLRRESRYRSLSKWRLCLRNKFRGR